LSKLATLGVATTVVANMSKARAEFISLNRVSIKASFDMLKTRFVLSKVTIGLVSIGRHPYFYVLEKYVMQAKEALMNRTLSHLTADGKPTMVDVSDKSVTKRVACASASVRFPKDVAQLLKEQNFRSKKGPIFDVATVAGTMAVKQTSHVIPFCHPLAIEKCNIQISMIDDVADITCEVSVEAKTGVEMEALHGASVAALTIYDMCKALSHDIQIESVRLIHKSGGKS